METNDQFYTPSDLTQEKDPQVPIG